MNLKRGIKMNKYIEKINLEYSDFYSETIKRITEEHRIIYENSDPFGENKINFLSKYMIENDLDFKINPIICEKYSIILGLFHEFIKKKDLNIFDKIHYYFNFFNDFPDWEDNLRDLLYLYFESVDELKKKEIEAINETILHFIENGNKSHKKYIFDFLIYGGLYCKKLNFIDFLKNKKINERTLNLLFSNINFDEVEIRTSWDFTCLEKKRGVMFNVRENLDLFLDYYSKYLLKNYNFNTITKKNLLRLLENSFSFEELDLKLLKDEFKIYNENYSTFIKNKEILKKERKFAEEVHGFIDKIITNIIYKNYKDSTKIGLNLKLLIFDIIPEFETFEKFLKIFVLNFSGIYNDLDGNEEDYLMKNLFDDKYLSLISIYFSLNKKSKNSFLKKLEINIIPN
jgi:hypothetical protein